MGNKKLPLSFYESCDTLTLARKLLGCELVHESPDGITSGIIVETEAYLANDPACHAYNRRTPRTEPMYASAGTIYIYLIYGMYQCINVVSNVKDVGEAVLIRALQPVEGIDLMQQRRQLRKTKTDFTIRPVSLKELCRGPGKLVNAMGIERDAYNNHLFTEGPLYIKAADPVDFEISSSARIGINVGVDLPYRFFIRNNQFVSR